MAQESLPESSQVQVAALLAEPGSTALDLTLVIEEPSVSDLVCTLQTASDEDKVDAAYGLLAVWQKSTDVFKLQAARAFGDLPMHPECQAALLGSPDGLHLIVHLLHSQGATDAEYAAELLCALAGHEAFREAVLQTPSVFPTLLTMVQGSVAESATAVEALLKLTVESKEHQMQMLPCLIQLLLQGKNRYDVALALGKLAKHNDDFKRAVLQNPAVLPAVRRMANHRASAADRDLARRALNLLAGAS